MLVAARIRTSTERLRELPTGVTSPSCSTRSSFACITRLMSPISSRKSVPPSALSNVPRRSATAPVKAPFTWPNISLSIELRRHRRAVHLHERPVAPGREGVDRAGHQLLARAPLARDHDARPRGRHHVHELVDALHRLGAAHHPVPGAVRPAPAGPLVAARHGREHPVEDVVEPLPGDRLLEVLRGAEPHRLHRVRHAAVARDHDHRGHRGAPLQLAQHVEARAVGQLQVEQDRGRRPLAEGPQPLADRGGPQGAVARAPRACRGRSGGGRCRRR